MAGNDSTRLAALEVCVREALELLARGAAVDAGAVLEGALTGTRREDGTDDLTHRCVLAMQAMLQDLPEQGRTVADTQALLGALLFAAHLGADALAMADIVSPQALAITLARIIRARR